MTVETLRQAYTESCPFPFFSWSPAQVNRPLSTEHLENLTLVETLSVFPSVQWFDSFPSSHPLMAFDNAVPQGEGVFVYVALGGYTLRGFPEVSPCCGPAQSRAATWPRRLPDRSASVFRTPLRLAADLAPSGPEEQATEHGATVHQCTCGG